MLHVVTIHFRSDRWIDVQRSYLDRHVEEPFQVWASVEGILNPGMWFDHVIPAIGDHAGKLNLLAAEVAAVASPDDLLMFLDGDAFPIADPMPVVHEALAGSDLVAVRRAENVDDPQPHPCFAVTSVRTWIAICGDWSAGYPWRFGDHITSDVGGNLLRLLVLHDKTWHELRRSNRFNLHPLWYGIYGDVVYHHGAGFRTAISRWDYSSHPPAILPNLAQHPRVGRSVRVINRTRARRWERRVANRRIAESDAVYDEIRDDPEFYRRFL